MLSFLYRLLLLKDLTIFASCFGRAFVSFKFVCIIFSDYLLHSVVNSFFPIQQWREITTLRQVRLVSAIFCNVFVPLDLSRYLQDSQSLTMKNSHLNIETACALEECREKCKSNLKELLNEQLQDDVSLFNSLSIPSLPD